MNWLVLAMALEVGWMPQGDFLMHEPDQYLNVAGTFYVDMEARATAFGFLFAGGEVRTFMWKYDDGGYRFDPERMLYQFNIGVTHGPVEVGGRFFCTHPMQTYLFKWEGTAKWEGAYSELYFRLEFLDK